MASFNELQDLNHTLRVTAVTALNNGLAGKKLAEIENEKNYLNAILQVSFEMNTVCKMRLQKEWSFSKHAQSYLAMKRDLTSGSKH